VASIDVTDLRHIYMPNLPINSCVRVNLRIILRRLVFFYLTCDDCALKHMIRCYRNFQDEWSPFEVRRSVEHEK